VIHLIPLNLGDFFHHSFHSFLTFLVMDCLIAEMLEGKPCLRKTGILSSGLDPNSDASLARVSACSLPIELMCPATRVKVRVAFGVVLSLPGGW
jgi:hypothetical protein